MQIINVDLVPGKVMPILHASQFDKGRSLGVKLYNGGAVFELSGAEDLTAAVRKPDGNIVTETLTNAGGSLVEIITTEQMTACAGGSLCKIKIENAGDVIGTANFVLEVEKDPTDGGIESASEINNLATQVADLVSEQYDSNNVIFDAVPTAGHGNGYTVTSEGIKDALDAINNPDASAVSYDNTDSGLAATNAQDAIDEVNDKADTNAANVGDLSQLTTTDKSSLVGAVNEVDTKATSKELTLSVEQGVNFAYSSVSYNNKLVTITAEVRFTGGANAWTNLATISKPPKVVQLSTPAVNSANGSLMGILQVQSSGNIRIYPTTAQNNGACAFSISYLTT